MNHNDFCLNYHYNNTSYEERSRTIVLIQNAM